MSIPALVAELAVQTTDADNYGPPLFEQLWQARYNTIGGTRAGASQGSLFNIPAHNLWYQMVEMTGLMYSGATGKDGSRNPMHNLTQWLPVFMAEVETGEATLTQQAVQRERLLKWCDEIRDLIDPPKSGRLPDVGCPNCGLYRYTAGEGNEADDGPAIAWNLRPGQDMTAACRNPECVDRITGYPSEWAGNTAIVQLGRLSGQAIDVDAIRESQAPVEEPPYDDNVKITVTPEDPLYTVVVASIGEPA